jgi:hypothetical protein
MQKVDKILRVARSAFSEGMIVISRKRTAVAATRRPNAVK